MHMELQRANMWKRISAWLFDAILLGMLSVGCAFLLSVILGYDAIHDLSGSFCSDMHQSQPSWVAL